MEPAGSPVTGTDGDFSSPDAPRGTGGVESSMSPHFTTFHSTCSPNFRVLLMKSDCDSLTEDTLSRQELSNALHRIPTANKMEWQRRQ